jgi:DNA-binding protein
MSVTTNPVQNLEKTIKHFAPKVKTKEQIDLLSRAMEVCEMVKGLPLDDITAKMVQLATSDLAARLKPLK